MRNLAVVLIFTAIFLVACGGGGSTAPTSPATPAALAPTNPPAATSAPATDAPAATQSSATTAPTESAATTAPTDAPTTAATDAASEPTAAATTEEEWVDPTPGEFTSEDVNHIFPPGRGQDMVFQNCTNCHNWVPLVFAQLDRAGWEQNLINHRERVSGLSEADHQFLIDYLVTNFPPDKEPPDNIPQELLDQWTAY